MLRSDDRQFPVCADGGPLGQVLPDAVFSLSLNLERRRLQCYVALIVTDVLCVLAGSWLANIAYGAPQGAMDWLVQGLFVAGGFLCIAFFKGLYSIDTLKRPLLGLLHAQVALSLAWSALIFFAFYSRSSEEFSRVSVTLSLLTVASMLVVARMAMRDFVRWRCGGKFSHELIIDDNGPTVDLPGAIVLSAEAMELTPEVDCPFSMDRFGSIVRHVDRVVVTCPPERRAAWAILLKGANVAGEVIDDAVAELGAQGARIEGSHGFLQVSASPLCFRSRVLKRLLDLSLAGAALVILSPLMLVIAIAIKLEDGGPVFFWQRRLGRGNRFFRVLKFRSMSVIAEDHDGNRSASRNDSRVTRVGRIIRRTSVDEFPQLINVIRGEMSLVGPRPHAIGSQAGEKLFWDVDLRYWQRHSLKPGMSGLAQVRGYRGPTNRESDLIDRLQSDLEYMEGWTIWRDLRIIGLTLRVMIHDRAY